ncbi:MAG TPA: S26 family signal peptidase [bacterium]|nr:S26 family signal peptidase [bacterium]
MCIRRYKITGWSMTPSLREGARVLASTIFRLRLADVVVCRHPVTGRETIKRIVRQHEDRYYVEGDNLSMSTDSRHFGPVTEQDIIAKVLLQYRPRFRVYL